MNTSRILLFSLLIVCSAHLRADACSFPESYRTETFASSVCIDNVSYPLDDVVLDAVSRWVDACEMGGTTPALEIGCGTGDVPVQIVFDTGVSDNPNGTCGYYQADAAGANTGGTITMFKYGRDPFTQAVFLCSEQGGTLQAVGDTLAHEIGHALGLADAPGSSCISRIMGAPSGDYSPTISADDCDAVAELWTTQQESGGGGSGFDPLYDDTPAGDDGAYDPRGESPILIDVAGNGIHLTNLASGVRFDLNADGVPEPLSWTAGAGDDAFLALDRNGNGTIDDGTELFGNYTPQAPSDEPNGFLALAEYDRPVLGGNGDGRFSDADAAFVLLLLWTDTNHNGLSERAELSSLTAGGVAALDLDYKESKRTDVYGNALRYRAKVTPLHSSPVAHWAWDVFFLSE